MRLCDVQHVGVGTLHTAGVRGVCMVSSHIFAGADSTASVQAHLLVAVVGVGFNYTCRTRRVSALSGSWVTARSP